MVPLLIRHEVLEMGAAEVLVDEEIPTGEFGQEQQPELPTRQQTVLSPIRNLSEHVLLQRSVGDMARLGWESVVRRIHAVGLTSEPFSLPFQLLSDEFVVVG